MEKTDYTFKNDV
jgi:hypothetical protein